MELKSYLKDYSFYHKNISNRLTHFIGIPLIIIGVLGLADRVPLTPRWFLNTPLTLAMLLLVASNLFYLRLHFFLGVTMVASTFSLYWISFYFPPNVLIVFFAVGWILQLLGHHRYEKNKPAFTKNFLHLLIGPLYIQNKILKIYRKY